MIKLLGFAGTLVACLIAYHWVILSVGASFSGNSIMGIHYLLLAWFVLWHLDAAKGGE